jgi:hypothetical protein
MTEVTKTRDEDLSVQEHCIDLPGETVQCWIGGGTDKLRVLLRKHRDVIFDIHLGTGQTYTLETTQSDFYNVRDKKLVRAKQHGKVTFCDGERMHVWVSRNFRGALVLKSDTQVIYKLEPNKWDTHQYGDDPKEKPAPIIVTIGAKGPPRPPALTKTGNSVVAPHPPAVAAPAGLTISAQTALPTALPHSLPVICVIDGTANGMPTELMEYFKKGGDHSGFSDIDPNHVSTRNWLWGQAAGAAAYTKDNWEWLRASLDGKTSKGFKLVRAQVHFVRGKVRFYFSGYSNENTIFGRGGFGPAHDRILTIFAGAGKTASTFAATFKGVASTFKEYALVSFIFGSATAIAEWKEDARKDGYDLAAALLTTTVKAVLAAGVTTLVVAGILWFVMVAVGVTMPVILVGSLTLLVGFGANYIIEAGDKSFGRTVSHDESNSDGAAAVIAPSLRKLGNDAAERIEGNWRYLMYKMSSDYREIAF